MPAVHATHDTPDAEADPAVHGMQLAPEGVEPGEQAEASRRMTGSGLYSSIGSGVIVSGGGDVSNDCDICGNISVMNRKRSRHIVKMSLCHH